MSTQSELDELTALAERLRAEFVAPVEFPEPAQRLGLKERAGDPVRQFKHLHQMCLGHVEHLVLSGRIKLLALLDGYLSAVSDAAVIGQYLFARTILEKCAFTMEVQQRLADVSRKPEANWLQKGEEFFSLIVRFRFATSDNAHQRVLASHGIPKKLLKPINVTNYINALASIPEVAHFVPLYDKLCDYVHHNSRSHFASSSGSFVGRVASHYASGRAIVSDKPGPISRYVYPTPSKAKEATDDTIAAVALAANKCEYILGKLHRSPYSKQQIVQMTGNEFGAMQLWNGSPHSTRH